MAKYPWAKIWVEILDDPKIKNMSDDLFRNFIYFILAAKEYDHDGELPAIKDLAWRLRLTEEQTVTCLSHLRHIGVTHVTEGSWYVTHFEKRQAQSLSPSAVRMRRMRAKRKMSASLVTSLGDASHSYSDSVSSLIIKDSLTGKNKFFSIRDSENALLQVTKFAALPPTYNEYLDKVLSFIQINGWEQSIDLLEKGKVAWCNQHNKTNGKPYSMVNPKWLDYVLAGEQLGTIEISEKERQDKELERIKEATKYQR
jgi:hypothetical protein